MRDPFECAREVGLQGTQIEELRMVTKAGRVCICKKRLDCFICNGGVHTGCHGTNNIRQCPTEIFKRIGREARSKGSRPCIIQRDFIRNLTTVEEEQYW